MPVFSKVVTLLLLSYAVIPTGSSLSLPHGQQVLDSSTASTSSLWDDPYSNRVFNSVWGFMDGFHQAFHPMGRALVPGVVKRGTLLYHGRGAGSVATGIDWFAFDAELSFLFASREPGTLWTYAATKDLKIVYFDGWSALKWQMGSLELQDKLIGLESSNELDEPSGKRRKGNAPPKGPGGGGGGGMNDGLRAAKLCEWGKEYGIDGFVRQEGIFELLFCDMEKNVRPVYSTNITIENGSPPRPGPGGPPGGSRNFAQAQSRYSSARAESWHLGTPDTRVKLFPEYTVSLYDPKYTSLHDIVRQSVFEQRVDMMVDADVDLLREELDRAFTAWGKGESSGVDWHSIHSAVADRFGSTLIELRAILGDNATVAEKNITALAEQVRALTYGTLMPFLDGEATLNITAPSSTSETTIRKEGFKRAFDICHTSFTGHLDASELNEQELRLKSSMDKVLGNICAFMVDTFVTSVVASEVAKIEVARWQTRTRKLMEWLEFPTFNLYPRKCRPDEVPSAQGSNRDGPAHTVLRCVGSKDSQGGGPP